jgi:acetyltransferase-like isoleucine patch superfamily enzyme
MTAAILGPVIAFDATLDPTPGRWQLSPTGHMVWGCMMPPMGSGLLQLRAAVMRGVVALLSTRPGLLSALLRRFTFCVALGREARIQAWRALGVQIGENVFIGVRFEVTQPANLTIGYNTKLPGKVWIDSAYPVVIGHDVAVNDDLTVLTAQHDVNSADFAGIGAPTSIGDYAWLPTKIIVLPGAHVGEGAVVGAGSVVTRPVEPYTIVAGNPARKIGDRVRQPYLYAPRFSAPRL